MDQFFENLRLGLYDAIHFYDSDYEVLNFSADIFRIVVVFIWIGSIFACIGMYYNSKVLGGLIGKLMASGARDAESAKTLEELGYGKKNFLLLRSLRDESTLRRYVIAREDADAPAEKKRSPADLAFYIPPEKADVAQRRFMKKSNGVLSTVLSIVV